MELKSLWLAIAALFVLGFGLLVVVTALVLQIQVINKHLQGNEEPTGCSPTKFVRKGATHV